MQNGLHSGQPSHKDVERNSSLWEMSRTESQLLFREINKEDTPLTLEAVDGTFTSACYHPCLTTKV